MVANRVCTTDCSSAKSSTTASSAAATTGVPGSAVIAVDRARGPATGRQARSTSVVVPERVIATTRS